MLVTIEGKYKDGKVVLDALPEKVTEANVLVTFLLPDLADRSSSKLRFGQFAGSGQSTEDDFLLAEWREQKDAWHGH